MSPLFDPSLAAQVQTGGIIAVLVVDNVESAIPLARALLAGGVSSMELTLRTPAAIDALREIRQAVPEMLAGVGTILTVEQLHAVVEAGGAFGVSPGVNPRVLAAARQAGLPFAPGVATPTDIEIAVEHGCQLLKLFPAGPLGGLSYLKAISAPYAHLGLKYIPLGGINEKNLAEYVSERSIAAIGGSWLAPRELIQGGEWRQITSLASRAVEIIKTTRASL